MSNKLHRAPQKVNKQTLRTGADKRPPDIKHSRKKTAFGKYFAECLSRIGDENKNVSNLNEAKLPQYHNQVTDENLAVYCIVCKNQGKNTKFLCWQAVSKHYLAKKGAMDDEEHQDLYNDVKSKCKHGMIGNSFLKSLVTSTPPPSIKTVKKTPSKYKCDECDSSYSRNRDLKAHKREKHGLEPPKRYPCTLCPKTFSQDSNRRAHERNVHTKSAFTNYHCDQVGCSFVTPNKTGLTRHQVMHVRNEKLSLKSSDLVKKSKFRFSFFCDD